MQRAAESKNFARQNLQQVREQQALNRERRRQDETAKQRHDDAVTRTKEQYAHVGSRVAPPTAPTAPVVGAADDVEITVFVRECDPDGHTFSLKESSVKADPAQPPAHGRRSAGSSRTAPAPHRQKSAPMEAPKAGRGQVPAYLQQRKAELADVKAQVQRAADEEAERAKYPPGHRPMGEDERAAVLDRLRHRKTELEGDLGRLPMRFDTQAVRQRRKQIEDEMAEVEAALQKFSVKRQLFVPV